MGSEIPFNFSQVDEIHVPGGRVCLCDWRASVPTGPAVRPSDNGEGGAAPAQQNFNNTKLRRLRRRPANTT